MATLTLVSHLPKSRRYRRYFYPIISSNKKTVILRSVFTIFHPLHPLVWAGIFCSLLLVAAFFPFIARAEEKATRMILKSWYALKI